MSNRQVARGTTVVETARPVGAAFLVVVAACNRQPPSPPVVPPESAAPPPLVESGASGAEFPRREEDAALSELDEGGVDLDAGLAAIDAPTDPMATHYESVADLLSLVWLPPAEEAATRRRDAFLRYNFGQGPGHFNQGNKTIAQHSISKAQCLAGLRGVVLQTPEQRAECGGAENMVPVYKDGKRDTAKYCIDIFEFPNKPCELPFVWTAPSATMTVCSMQGKRLCTQDEWQMACRLDPAGGRDSIYAYGDELDMTICNTNKPHPTIASGSFKCNGYTAESAWRTCETMTEPVGAFPKCKSRFGVYDFQGNVAEVMTRKDPDAGLVSQLKGSAFFYVDVARKHNEPHPKDAPRETYPDHCNFDPRWHVEPMQRALHVNYHLGFRCCKTIDAGRDAGTP